MFPQKHNYEFLIDFSEVGELDLGLARVQDISAEQLREMDPMNIAFVKLDDSLRIIMSGYLWKLSRSMVPTTTPGCASALVSKWSRRFFVLRADSCLYFFKKEQVNYYKCILVEQPGNKSCRFRFNLV